jgi:SAM-dependent methyltransferase
MHAAPAHAPRPADDFDEAAYLAANADVRAAVLAGTLASGAVHYAAFGQLEGRPLRLRVLRSLAELDREVDRLREIEQRSMSEWLRARAGFTFEEDVAALSADPFSEAYRQAQLALYCLLSGRQHYDAPSAEAYAIPVGKYVDPTPYPFSSRDGGLIGSHLVAVGHIMQTIWQLRPQPGLTMLEYGCGTGVTTVLLAASGYEMTAVDINPDMLKVVETIARERRLSLRTHCDEFGAVPEEGERFDVILFYEAFHHCLDFEGLLRKLHDRLAPGGLLILAGEPVFADFPKPWGLRLDGPALFDIRKNGWLELGFREDFFHAVMARTGWRCDKFARPPAPDLFVATPHQPYKR